MKLSWRPKARSDLEAIREFTQREWGRSQAETYLRTIRAAAREAARNPLATASAEHIKPGYRKVTVKAHIVLFVVIEDRIEVARVLHGAMDIPERLE